MYAYAVVIIFIRIFVLFFRTPGTLFLGFCQTSWKKQLQHFHLLPKVACNENVVCFLIQNNIRSCNACCFSNLEYRNWYVYNVVFFLSTAHPFISKSSKHLACSDPIYIYTGLLPFRLCMDRANKITTRLILQSYLSLSQQHIFIIV